MPQFKVNKEDIKVSWGKWKPFVKFFVSPDLSSARFGVGYTGRVDMFRIEIFFLTVFLAFGIYREEMVEIPEQKPIPAALVRLREAQNKKSESKGRRAPANSTTQQLNNSTTS